ncbi:MAG: hypothetical protein J0L81_00180 [Caulobacterales bacterium]|jgi:hypothetical protein|nr:hypothetical protein [Caulobacterales bacterium]
MIVTPAACTDPTAELWRAARAMFVRMCFVMGTAADIAALGLCKSQIPRLQHWIAALESFVRKVLVMEVDRLTLMPPKKRDPFAKKKEPPAPAEPRERKRTYPFKLWPKPKQHPARITLLGAPTSVAEIRRAHYRSSLIARLKSRREPTPPHKRYARRILALQHLLKRPRRAILRLARKLKRFPRLAVKLALGRPWDSPHVPPELCAKAAHGSYNAARNLLHPVATLPDTS